MFICHCKAYLQCDRINLYAVKLIHTFVFIALSRHSRTSAAQGQDQHYSIQGSGLDTYPQAKRVQLVYVKKSKWKSPSPDWDIQYYTILYYQVVLTQVWLPLTFKIGVKQRYIACILQSDGQNYRLQITYTSSDRE